LAKRGPKPRFLDVACPNEDCTLFGISGKGNVTCCGNYMICSGKLRKYRCHTCDTRFCDRTNTAFFNLRTSEDKVRMALEMVAKGISIQEIADVLKSKPSTIRHWVSKASDHREKVNEAVQKDVETPKVEMDELGPSLGKREPPRP